jgi:hypothetical protein
MLSSNEVRPARNVILWSRGNDQGRKETISDGRNSQWSLSFTYMYPGIGRPIEYFEGDKYPLIPVTEDPNDREKVS